MVRICWRLQSSASEAREVHLLHVWTRGGCPVLLWPRRDPRAVGTPGVGALTLAPWGWAAAFGLLGGAQGTS